MARARGTFNSVDLTRALKAAKASGLTITYTQIGPDGKITIGHSLQDVGSDATSPDDLLENWKSKRHKA